MFAPHEVTLFLARSGTVRAWHMKAFIDESETETAGNPGLTEARAVKLYISKAAQVRDASGVICAYIEEKSFDINSSNSWTIADHGQDGITEAYFCKGTHEPAKYSDLIKTEKVYRVSGMADRDFGSARMRHWEVVGS